MLLLLGFIGSMAVFVLAILLVERPTRDEKQIATRFAALRMSAQAENAADAGGLLRPPDREALSRFQQMLAATGTAAWFRALLLQANTGTTPGKLSLLCAAAGICGTLAVLPFRGLISAFLPVLAVAPAAGLAAGYLPVFRLTVRRNRRLAAFNKALPESIDMIARSMRAGHSLIAAIGIVAEQAPEPAKTEFGEIYRKQNFGLPLRDAMMELLDRVPSQDLRVMVTGVLVQKDTGGNLPEILDRISGVIRARMKIQADIRVHTAQGRMTGWILCLLPPAMLLVINLINPGYSHALTDDPTGRKLLALGVGLLVTGALLIKKIVDSVEV